MRVLVNGLSVTNQSGRHVLMGHLEQLRQWTQGRHDFVILHHEQNEDMVVDRDGFRWVRCPESTSRWFRRAVWEYFHLDRVSNEQGCDFLFTPAGVTVPGIRTPQVVFCQNPWCLVRSLHKTPAEKFKAFLQRRAYRRTMRDANLMVFNSEFMHHAYRDNAGKDAQQSMVVYQAISDSTRNAAGRLGKSLMEENHVVCVSAMGDHKGAETLVEAIRIVRERGVDARLTFAGGWPDPKYRSRIESVVRDNGLAEHITFSGWLSDESLMELYSRAHVFCLLSRCESFGIPAVEAQSFGTPALGTDTCAIPEVGGAGGMYSTVDDPDNAADNLIEVLTDPEAWHGLSTNARRNAERFQWEQCSRPLLNMFDQIPVAADAVTG